MGPEIAATRSRGCAALWGSHSAKGQKLNSPACFHAYLPLKEKLST